MIELMVKIPRLEITNREYFCLGKLWKYIFQSGEFVMFALQCFMKRSCVMQIQILAFFSATDI